MVHALEITHDLLKPGGLMIDIHPTGEQPLVEAHVDGEVRLAGYLDELDDFESYFKADEALAQVTSRGLFLLEREGSFTFLYHAATVAALADFIAAEWTNSVLPEETIEQAEALMGEPGDGREIVVREHVRIARYRAIPK